VALAATWGCGGTPPAVDQAAPPPLLGTKVRLVVADDPPMAAAIGRLRDQWTAESGSELEVRETTGRELAAAQRLPGDAVICPSGLLTTLAERGLVAPLAGRGYREDSGPWSETFDLLRVCEATWAGQTMAVPLGSPLLCCYYRADLLAKLGRRPPQTWAEYIELARLLKAKEGGPPRYGTIEPLAPGWAGLVLLAHAAPYVKHPDNYSALFDIETMEPLLTGPPWVRALEELVEAAKLGPAEPGTIDPAAARAAFWRGECGMALSWPTAARQTPPLVAEGAVRAGLAELPGSSQVYNVGTNAWENRPEEAESQVPLLGVAGRIGVVRTGLDRPQAAMQLLAWLSGSKWSPQVCPPSPAATLFRRSHLAAPQEWVERPVPASMAAAYAALTEATLRRRQCLWAVRLPGREEYLAALDEAVQAATHGTKSPAEALAATADRWRQITARLGLQPQKAAYLHSLGLR
jgi:multiple sugar transport system substrate-binding protein